MRTSQIKQLAATADVTTADAYLKAVSLTGGSDAATLTVKAGGSSGTTILVVKVAASTTVAVPDLHDAYCADGIHATFTGTAPSATFVYE
jgi:copper(I)-binding protein